MLRALLILLFALPALTISAGMNISAGTGAHTHADANTGGSTLYPSLVNVNGPILTRYGSQCLISKPGTVSIANTYYDTTCAAAATGIWNAFEIVQLGYYGERNQNFHLYFGLNVATVGQNRTLKLSFRKNNYNVTPAIELDRWVMRPMTADPETGADAGTNYQFEAYKDDGTPATWGGTIDGTMTGVALRMYRADGTTKVSGTFVSVKACASGYTRTTPNLCMKSGAPEQVDNGFTACTQTAPVTNVTDAVAVLARVTTSATAINAVGLRQTSKTIYGPADSGCSTALTYVQTHIFEQVATPVLNTLMQKTEEKTIRSGSTGRFYVTGVQNASGAILTIDIIGYLD